MERVKEEEVVKELRAIRTLLEEIEKRLPVAAPVVPPVVKPPAIPEELREVYVEALKRYGALFLANDLHVETIDLGKDRSTSANIEELPKLWGIALTIFRNTGTFDLYINVKDDYHKLTFDALTYPQTFLLDWFRAKTFYVGNAAQSGKTLVLVAWRLIG